MLFNDVIKRVCMPLVQGGDITFEDRPVGVTHRIEGIELGVPFSTLMSMMFLGEIIRWRRAATRRHQQHPTRPPHHASSATAIRHARMVWLPEKPR